MGWHFTDCNTHRYTDYLELNVAVSLSVYHFSDDLNWFCSHQSQTSHCYRKPRGYNAGLFLKNWSCFHYYPWTKICFHCIHTTNSTERSSSWEASRRTQLVKKFLYCVTRPRHWTVSWTTWIQSTNSQTVSLSSILILSSHLYPGFPSCLFFQTLLPKFCTNFTSSHACYMHNPSNNMYY